jgi:hypothetical protein
MKNVKSRPCRTLFLLIFVMTTLGCTTLRPVVGTDKRAISDQISVGNKVEVTLQDHSVTNFRVDEITEIGIGGDGIFIDFRDIRQIHTRKLAVGRTVFGIVGGVGIVVLVALIDSGPFLPPGP